MPPVCLDSFFLCPDFRVWDIGFRIWGLWVRDKMKGFWVCGLGLRVKGPGFRGRGLEYGVEGLGCGVKV